MKIPYPGDLNPIEIAVWAAEYVRVLAHHRDMTGSTDNNDITIAVEKANNMVDDLRRVRERS